MRPMKKRMLSVLMALALVLGLCTPLGELLPTAQAAEIVDSGRNDSSEGEDYLYWTFTSDGTLTLSGAYRVNFTFIPWDDYKPQIERVVVEPGVTYIGIYSFSDCENLKSVSIADTVDTIEWGTFQGCTSLKEIELPDSIRTLYIQAFMGSGLTSIRLPEGLERIETRTFADCTDLEWVYIPSSVTEILRTAFSGCSALSDIYYGGSEADWNEITFYEEDDTLSGVDIHFESTGPDGGDQPSLDPSLIPVPVLREARNDRDGITIVWNDDPVLPDLPDIPELDVRYQILRKTAGESAYQQIAEVTGASTNTYTDLDAEEGTAYVYTVRMVIQGVQGSYDETGLSIRRTGIIPQDVDLPGGSGMLPLQGGGVAVILEEALPSGYLDDGLFTGSIQLVSDGTVHAAAPATYDAENQMLVTTLTPVDGGMFPPNTTMTLQILDQEGTVLADISLKTKFQEWATTNFDTADAPLSDNLVYLMLGGDPSSDFLYSNKADELFGKDVQPGKGGFCFGMALSVSLFNWSDVYQLRGYDTLNESPQFVENGLIHTQMAGEYRAFSATEFIQLCHLVQYLSPVQKALNQNRWDYAGLLPHIDRYKRGEACMPLAWIADKESDQSHALGAFDYRIEGADLYILCYDCNLASVQEIKVTDYQDPSAAKWSFELLGWSGPQDIGDKLLGKNAFSYYVPNADDDLFLYADASRSDVLASAASAGVFEQAQTSGSLEVTPIACLASAGTPLLADASPFPDAKSWLSGTGELTLDTLEEGAQITLADGAAAYRMLSASSYAASLQNGSVDDVSAGGEDLRLSCAYYTADGCKVDVALAGSPSTPDSKVTMEKTEDAVVFHNVREDSVITVTYQDPEGSAPEEFPAKTVGDDGTVRVEADGTNAPTVTETPDHSGSDHSGGSGSSSSGRPSASVDGDGGTVTTGNGTVIITPDDGYETDSVTVNGKEVDIPTDGILTGLKHGDQVVVTFAKKCAFADVPRDAYCYEAVQWAVEEGITSGTTATTFSPALACTRAQAVTFLWRAAGSPVPKSSQMPFTDVPSDAYYRSAVSWAVENGITSGTTATTFSPDAACSRAQIVTFLWRADGSSPQPVSSAAFDDVGPQDYFWSPVRWALDNGITTGVTADAFRPHATCTRAQIVTFLYRAYA